MMRAIELAKNGIGFVSPNPLVGAVIVREGEIIGEGWHKSYGEPHAEVDAINRVCLDSFEDCTIYVNLEPCSHYGKTPPCADLIIHKKFGRVVIATLDPNPLVAGKGVEKLKNAGIEVITGVCEEEAKWLNRTFFKYISEGKPYIVLKIAQSLDGFIALKNGNSKWISSEESRKISHSLRSELDAVLVGKNTVIKDDPQLTVRLVSGRDPYRIICDTNLEIPLDTKIFRMCDNEKTIVCCSNEHIECRKVRNLRLAGIEVIGIELNGNGNIDLIDLFVKLMDKYRITSIMVEGGAGIYSSFLNEDLIDELHIFTAPKVFGVGISTFHNVKTKKVDMAKTFKIRQLNMSGEDIYTILIKKVE